MVWRKVRSKRRVVTVMFGFYLDIKNPAEAGFSFLLLGRLFDWSRFDFSDQLQTTIVDCGKSLLGSEAA